jgi:tetratricopeptide (TPR) repeat protein
LNAAAYNDLLKENLDLRRQIAQTEKEREAAAAENRRLKEELKDLDSRIADSTRQIQALRKARVAAEGDAGKVAELEAKLLKVEEERGRLSGQLGELQAKIAAVEARPPVSPVVAASVEAPPPSAVASDSDLFRRLQEENIRLKGRMLEVEKDRQREREELDRIAKRGASGARSGDVKQRERELQRELDATRERERKTQRTVEQLLEQIPVLETKLNEVEREQAKKDATLTEKEQELTTLKEEVQRREKRVEKAERMAAMLDSARDQVRQVSDREKRDMHYNMAAVYAREGRYADAEREYLTALDIDPSDAHAHYNLGILYDDELKDKRRAAMHYRRYLKLRPGAPDVDQVKDWLMRTEMGQ